MEPISSITNQHQNAEIAKRESETSLEKPQKPFSEEAYLAQVQVIVTEVLGFSYPGKIEHGELIEKRDIWFDNLIESVPFEMLNPAYQRAKQDHNSSFPLTGMDVLNAYKRIECEKAQRPIELDSPESIATCKFRSAHFLGKFEGEYFEAKHGIVVYYNPAADSEYSMPCPYCQPKAFEDKRLSMPEVERAVSAEARNFIARVDEDRKTKAALRHVRDHLANAAEVALNRKMTKDFIWYQDGVNFIRRRIEQINSIGKWKFEKFAKS